MASVYGGHDLGVGAGLDAEWDAVSLPDEVWAELDAIPLYVPPADGAGLDAWEIAVDNGDDTDWRNADTQFGTSANDAFDSYQLQECGNGCMPYTVRIRPEGSTGNGTVF